jgi:DNA-binding transcriptional LysR family regulator
MIAMAWTLCPQGMDEIVEASLMDIDLRLLRYVATVAQEHSFTRAAQQLAITQPALSRAIRSLENAVGVDLLVRGPHGVEATAAGKVLLEETRRIPAQIRIAVQHARSVALNEERLRLAIRGCDVEVAAQLVATYQHDCPPETKTHVDVSANDAEPPGDSLRQGTCDIALVRDLFDTTDLDREPLLSEPRVALLSGTHPLADRPRVGLEELHDDPITVWRSMTPAEQTYWAGADEDGHPWRPGPRVSSASDMLAAVRLNQAIAFVPASRAPVASAIPGLRARPVLGLSPGKR